MDLKKIDLKPLIPIAISMILVYCLGGQSRAAARFLLVAGIVLSFITTLLFWLLPYQRACSVTVALALLGGLICLGYLVPEARAAMGFLAVVGIVLSSLFWLLPRQRACSVTVALALLAELIYLGYVVPEVKDRSSFGSRPPLVPWPLPYRMVMAFHWLWCIPLGVLLAAGIIAKDRRYSPLVAGRINLVAFWAGLLILGTCIFVLFSTPDFKTPELIPRPLPPT